MCLNRLRYAGIAAVIVVSAITQPIVRAQLVWAPSDSQSAMLAKRAVVIRDNALDIELSGVLEGEEWVVGIEAQSGSPVIAVAGANLSPAGPGRAERVTLCEVHESKRPELPRQ